ncbi:hypothetical protein FQN54_008928 [Arachnomyces sp. PD_36]|nr:hypothetical protein FQN54_008928 [Arachnomyces sp. PD_36]
MDSRSETTPRAPPAIEVDVLPNDEREQERLDLVHYIFRTTLDGDLCYTKLENPQKILDVGTGTGIWAIEIGNEYPSAEVIGTDLSPIQPGCGGNTATGLAVPPNVQFQVDDATHEWTFPTASFDFIHIRTLYGAISDWPALLRECYKALKPGGQVEIAEMRTKFFCDDGSYPQDSAMQLVVDEIDRISRSVGLELDVSPFIPDWLKAAGFKEVEQAARPVPVGTWPKDRKMKQLGYYMVAQIIETALDSFTIALFTRHGGYTEEQVRVLGNRARDEMKTNKLHVYTKL